LARQERNLQGDRSVSVGDALDFCVDLPLKTEMNDAGDVYERGKLAGLQRGRCLAGASLSHEAEIVIGDTVFMDSFHGPSLGGGLDSMRLERQRNFQRIKIGKSAFDQHLMGASRNEQPQEPILRADNRLRILAIKGSARRSESVAAARQRD